mgnify:FL=1
MRMMYQAHRRAIERLYEDRATITRHMKYEDPITKETKYELETIYENQPCRISQRALAANAQTESVNPIAYETKLFIAPELEIKQGDVIEVTRGAVTRKYTAGEPFIYPTHQEVSIQRDDEA